MTCSGKYAKWANADDDDAGAAGAGCDDDNAAGHLAWGNRPSLNMQWPPHDGRDGDGGDGGRNG